MTRLRHAVTLAICVLFSMPLCAAALEFQTDFEQFPPGRALEAGEPTASALHTIVLRTSAAVEALPASHLFLGGVSGTLTNRPLDNFDLQVLNPHANPQASRAWMFRRAALARARLARFRARTPGPPPIPEPTTAVLMGIGLIGLAAAGRRYDA